MNLFTRDRSKEKGYVKEPQALLEGREYKEDMPWSCKYCHWWAGKKKGCELEQCYYLVQEEDILQDVEENPDSRYGNCKTCPYGKHKVCIGYCIAKLRRDQLKAEGRC